MNIMVIHGPNLNLLGTRKPEIYGTDTLDEINSQILCYTNDNNIKVKFFQSNNEGEIVDLLHSTRNNFQGVVINPAAYTHYSYAIADAIEAIDVPVVEVHLSNIHGREEFRKKSVIAPYAIGQISGFGPYGYILAVEALLNARRKEEGLKWKD